MKKEIFVGNADYNNSGSKRQPVTFEIELRQEKRDSGYVTIDLNQIDSYTELSICGNVYMSHWRNDAYTCGQCLDTILELFPHDKFVQLVHRIWDRFHLNGMNSGTRKQRELVKALYSLILPNERYDYTVACDFLAENDLLVDNGYKYGTAWLVELLPEDIIQVIEDIINA